MKKLITLLLVLVTLNGYSQTPIDYDNFDREVAEFHLREAFLHFRDTITKMGYDKERFILYPELLKDKSLDIPIWSDKVYELISKHNCDILTNIKDDVYHVDREKWWEDPKTQKLFVEEKYKHIEDEKIRESITEVGYSENALFTTKKFTTYEELATALINQWENSYYHKCLQRRNMFCTYLYRSHNIIVKDLFACSVTYNPSTKCVHSVINFI